MCWVPSHMGISGKEAVDKAFTLNLPFMGMVMHPLYLQSYIDSYVDRLWHKWWNRLSTERLPEQPGFSGHRALGCFRKHEQTICSRMYGISWSSYHETHSNAVSDLRRSWIKVLLNTTQSNVSIATTRISMKNGLL